MNLKMKKAILFVLTIITGFIARGQEIAKDLILSSYSNQSAIQALNSITLKDGFYIPAGKTVTISLAAFPTLNSKPSIEQNYILTRTYRTAVKSNELSNVRTIDKENQTIQYYDGQGRPIQVVQLMASPTFNDIVQHIEYDAFGREVTKYLPYAEQASGNGAFKDLVKTNQSNFYKVGGGWDATVTKTGYPYSTTVFDNSPLNRVLQQGAPGATWQPPANRDLVAATTTTGRTVVSEYGTNGTNDVKMWTVNATNNGATSTYYGAGKLSRLITKDENWVKANGLAGTVEEYKDLSGRVVLKRIWNINEQTNTEYAVETYYIYDDFGNLRYVLPPMAKTTTFTESSSDPYYNKYIYGYKYDTRRRVVEKKVPGKDKEFLVYNKNDQVVLTQDSVQCTRKEWKYNRYDAFGRITSTGLYTNTTKITLKDMQGLVDANTGPLWETRTGADYPTPATTFPVAGTGVAIKPHVVNYYDDYGFSGATTLPESGVTRGTKIWSLPTGSKVYKVDGTTPLLTVLYYDNFGRVIQTASQNHLGGTDYVTNTYNLPGDLLTSTRIHTPKTGGATTIITTNTYDHVGRLTSTKEKIGSQAEVTLATNSYNEIGQLKTRYMGKAGTEAKYVDTTSYSYNERGWTKRIASNNFTESVMYQDGGVVRQYNGNIAQQLWRFTPSGTTSTFEYSYDKLNRLTKGASSPVGAASMTEVIDYDDMGNIKTLKRDALAVTSYTYAGNKLTSLSGGGNGNYTYDANGNAKTDRMGTVFTYNYLNLPQTAVRTGTSVSFLYDALGTKLKKEAKIGTTTTIRDYVDGIEYNNGTIDIIHNSVGYAQLNGTSYVYHYNLTDHLGNVRTTLKRRPGSTTVVDVVQRDNYYPFGKRKVVAGGNNKYLYNGKEIQGELGDQYDYGARFYDAEIGRWNVVDPLAEQMRRHSPYNYAFNNPIRFIDPDGMAPTGWGKNGDSWVFNEEVTKDNYKDLGYSQYMDAGKVYSVTNGKADGKYSFTLNADGSVQTSSGSVVNYSFKTDAGTTITPSSTNLAKATVLVGDASNLNSQIKNFQYISL